MADRLPRLYFPRTCTAPADVPGGEERSFSDGFIASFVVTEPDAYGKQTALARWRPYNYDDSALYPSVRSDITWSTRDWSVECARSPVVAQTVGALVVVLNLLFQEDQLTKQIVAMPAGEAKTAAQAALAATKTALGIS